MKYGVMGLLLLSACGGPRKACHKAERHMARAAWLCPGVLQADSATTTLPGTVATLPHPALQEAHLDSLEDACRQLAEALAAERELYAAVLGLRQPVPVATPRVVQAATAVQRVACQYQPMVYEHELFTLRMAGGSTPGIVVQVHDRQVAVPCPPRLVPPQRAGVAPWYRGAFWVLAIYAILVSYIILRSATSAWRANEPHA